MNFENGRQKIEVRSQKTEARATGLKHSFIIHHSSFRLLFLLASVFCFLTPAFAGTHVTGVYSVGASPAVMATVNGNSEYGLVFAQRNTSVTYNNVLYVNNVVTAYFDINGNLNDGSGNQWIDLIPDANATPGDSYYVVTINIQGSVHSEIWIVPDQASVNVLSVRQTTPPPSGSTTIPVFFYQTVQQTGANLTQRPTLNLTGAGVSCLDNSGLQRTDCTITSGSGSGTLTSFSAGTLSPLFTTSVATATTTPALTFSLSNAGAHAFLGNNTGGSAAPAFVQPAFTDISGGIAASQLPNPSASTLGGIESLASASHKWINTISTSGVPSATQPADTDISGTTAGAVPYITGGALAELSTTGYSTMVSGATNPSWATPTANGQCFMSGASSYATTTPSFQSCPSGGGSPGGSNTQVQFNNSSAFGGDSNMTWNNSTHTFTVTNITITGIFALNAGYLDTAEQASPGNPAASTVRSYVDSTTHKQTFINSSGAIALTLPNPSATALGGTESLDCTGSGHIVKISTSGVPTCAADTGGMSNPMTTLGDIIYENSTPAAARLAGQTTTTKEYLSQTGNGSISAVPAWAQVGFGDLSGSVAAGQMPALTGAVVTSGGAVATTPGKIDVLNASQFCADAGSTDTYACNLSPAITAYVTGTHYRFKANTANTGAASINFNSVGAITIKKAAGGITTDLATNDILVGQWVDLVYDGTNMQMQSTLGNAPAGSGTVTTSGSPASPQLAKFTSSTSITGATAHDVAVPLTCLDSSGSGTAQSCTTAPTFAPAAGDTIIYKTTTTNTGDLTINVNSSSAVHVRKWQSASTLASGDLASGVYVHLTYDGTYWQIPTIASVRPSPLDTTVFMERDDFCGGAATSSGQIGELGWTVSVIGTSGITEAGIAAAAPNLCVEQLTTSGTTARGGSVYLGTSSGVQTMFQALGNTSNNWDSKFTFAMGVTAATSVYIGYSGTMTSTPPVSFIGLRFDTSATSPGADAAFRFVVCKSSTCTAHGTTYTADTNYHTVRIRSTASGQVALTFDANAEICFNSGGTGGCTTSANVPTASVGPVFQIVNQAGAAQTLNLDFFAFIMTGLAR